ncbi:hypothetical protein QBC46DRAFT_359331 [Diplogelasinospora grovesii]|uniref:Uncharacterized protein n=1 Tax=Diplogelasinospora grovesii TaxID=303347 RepID=A0AAN6RYL4_9PEZI|nr:hypothetical protein QBC46DRAFT_359331 [Diplogelasinospora grovesii]
MMMLSVRSALLFWALALLAVFPLVLAPSIVLPGSVTPSVFTEAARPPSLPAPPPPTTHSSAASSSLPSSVRFVPRGDIEENATLGNTITISLPASTVTIAPPSTTVTITVTKTVVPDVTVTCAVAPCTLCPPCAATAAPILQFPDYFAAFFAKYLDLISNGTEAINKMAQDLPGVGEATDTDKAAAAGSFLSQGAGWVL